MTNQLRAEGDQKFIATGVGTNAGATATFSAKAGERHIVTHISGSSDGAAVVTVESPASTVLWQKRFASAFTFSESFHYGELEAPDGSDILVKVSASTTHSEANLAGVRAGI